MQVRRPNNMVPITPIQRTKQFQTLYDDQWGGCHELRKSLNC